MTTDTNREFVIMKRVARALKAVDDPARIRIARWAISWVKAEQRQTEMPLEDDDADLALGE